MPEYRDRTNNYVPDGLFETRNPNVAEIYRQRDGETGERHPVVAPVVHGLADGLNREQHWQWADVSGDRSHWSHFNGHMVQIDVTFTTENWRDVNDWKGRDEIRKGGSWTLALNRQPCWEGHLGGDPLAALRGIPRIVEKLLEHPAICWWDPAPAAEQLAARRVYYDQTPAVVSSTSVLGQGCVMLKPVGVEFFPLAVHTLDDEDGIPDDPYERREYKVGLLSPHVWWWRRKAYGDETNPPKPPLVPVGEAPEG